MGSKEIPSTFIGIVPDEKRLSVTVGIVLSLSGDKVLHRRCEATTGVGFEQREITYPLVRTVGPTLYKKEVSINTSRYTT